MPRSSIQSLVPILVLVSGLVETVAAQTPESLEQQVYAAKSTDEQQAICESAFDQHFSTIFDRDPDARIPPELAALWKACDGLLLPSSDAMNQLRQVRANLGAAFPDTVVWDSFRFLGHVRETRLAVEEMISTAVVLSNPPGTPRSQARLVAIGDLSLTNRDRTASEIATSVRPGDYLLELRLRDRQTNREYRTRNSISPDGRRFSGLFFLSTRLEGGLSDPVILPNTVCRTQTTRNVFGGIADRFEGCVRATCDSHVVRRCLVTKSECRPGLMGDCGILPYANSVGDIDQPDCRTAIRFAWTTGLKSVAISADKLTLRIEGTIGQSGEGSFLVEERCPGESISAPTLVERFGGDVLFAVDSFQLTTAGKQAIDRQIVAPLSGRLPLSVVIDGHTDNTGRDSYNQWLSEWRAKAVRDYLVSRGIPPHVIAARGHGETRPVEDNATDWGRAQNRRVEIVVQFQH